MFTYQTFSINILAKGLEAHVARDGNIAFVAKIPSPLPNRLVPCGAMKYVKEAMQEAGIAGMIVPAELADQVPRDMALVIANNPMVMAMDLHESLAARENGQWRSFPSQVHASALVHPSATIAERDVKIGAGTRIGPGAIIMERSLIGANSIIGPGTVVGCDAFQVFKKDGRQRVLRQSGGVRIGDEVELQANCTVSRAVFGGFTEIGTGTILDSQVHVGHDCVIGRQVLIANQVSLAGRVVLEDNVYIAPNVTISNGLTLGKGSQVTIGSTVLGNVAPGLKVTGYHAQPHDKWMMQFIRAQRKK